MSRAARVVLTVLAHPDDAEILCAGTLVRLARECGWAVHIATLTPGDCGSAVLGPDDIARVRRAEAAQAAARLGGAYTCLEERDLFVTYCPPALVKVTHLLRRVRPQLVLTHSPADYMIDHEETSRLARAAAFAAPIPNFAAEPGLAPLDTIPHLYYCDPIEGHGPLGEEIAPDFRIDISAAIEEKAELLKCHASQRDWLLKHHGMDHYVESMRAWATERGQQAGVPFAEGFRQHRGHAYPQSNLLGELLGTV